MYACLVRSRVCCGVSTNLLYLAGCDSTTASKAMGDSETEKMKYGSGGEALACDTLQTQLAMGLGLDKIARDRVGGTAPSGLV